MDAIGEAMTSSSLQSISSAVLSLNAKTFERLLIRKWSNVRVALLGALRRFALPIWLDMLETLPLDKIGSKEHSGVESMEKFVENGDIIGEF
jgi:hypothetical protein